MCIGRPALRDREKLAEGACSTKITLWGVDVDTSDGTFTLPDTKIGRAVEFLASSELDSGNTRIQLTKLQQLRGEMEHWSLRNAAIRPEFAAVDRLLVNYHEGGQPKGTAKEMKQTYLEFWESAESMRASLATPEKWVV